MDRLIKFNTGRGYSPEGQIIGILAREGYSKMLDESGLDLFFYDKTRCVMGIFWMAGDASTSDNDIIATMMYLYDHGGYRDLHTLCPEFEALDNLLR